MTENPAPQPPEDQTPTPPEGENIDQTNPPAPPVPETPEPDEPQPDTPELPEEGEPEEPEIPEPEIPEETPPEPEEPAPEPEIPEETPPEEAPKPELSPEEIFLQLARQELLAKIEEKLLSDPLIKEYVTLTLAGTQNLLATFRELESWFIQNKIDISEHLAFIKEKYQDFAEKVDNFFKDSQSTIEEQKQIFEAVQAIKAEIDPALEAIKNATALIEEKAQEANTALEGTNNNAQTINGYLDEVTLLKADIETNSNAINERMGAFQNIIDTSLAGLETLYNQTIENITTTINQALQTLSTQGNEILTNLNNAGTDTLNIIDTNKTEALEAIGTSKTQALELIQREKEAIDLVGMENLKTQLEAQKEVSEQNKNTLETLQTQMQKQEIPFGQRVVSYDTTLPDGYVPLIDYELESEGYISGSQSLYCTLIFLGIPYKLNSNGFKFLPYKHDDELLKKGVLMGIYVGNFIEEEYTKKIDSLYNEIQDTFVLPEMPYKRQVTAFLYKHLYDLPVAQYEYHYWDPQDPVLNDEFAEVYRSILVKFDVPTIWYASKEMFMRPDEIVKIYQDKHGGTYFSDTKELERLAQGAIRAMSNIKHSYNIYEDGNKYFWAIVDSVEEEYRTGVISTKEIIPF
ncbi:hypothetical protein [Helicobacter sp. 11S02596-1]|uniref:coiled-coil domain-containing protein n=1 Tax=Helicobacter sp. 11S02596-1 TaxID=1476194 RepID=UPI000BA7D175|nr:hypothetical protein [Helicobacter sp. 11S02596-1]PAF41127.1 hypothetical protein BJI48_09035 [Helicobacter sp. 11S02596-1]